MVKPSEQVISGGYDNISVIIVAAGSGSRFGSDIPKQYLPLNGKPVIVHTIEAFKSALPHARLCIVISESGQDLWLDVAEKFGLNDVITVFGGSSRTESVHNALTVLRPSFNSDDIVLVHDGARPLVNKSMIRHIVETLQAGAKAVVPVHPLTEAIAECGLEGVNPIDRSRFVTVQTPQGFNALTLASAYDTVAESPMPDDAAVYRAYTGKPLITVPGHPQNIKITHPADIELAEVHLRHPIPYVK